MESVLAAHLEVLCKTKASDAEGDWHSVGKKREARKEEGGQAEKPRKRQNY